jgi:hypothetical protein
MENRADSLPSVIAHRVYPGFALASVATNLRVGDASDASVTFATSESARAGFR